MPTPRCLFRSLAPVLAGLLLVSTLDIRPAWPQSGASSVPSSSGGLKPRDSVLAIRPGEPAPDFDLPAVAGGRVRLSDYRGRKNVVLTFIPAAWTPVCSSQWPGYNIAQEVFDAFDATLVGLSVDNLPTLRAWIKDMGGVWFPVVSDFWPHGAYAAKLGVLRSDGMTERALFLIDKQGIVRYVDVHDINARPDLGALVKEMQSLEPPSTQ